MVVVVLVVLVLLSQSFIPTFSLGVGKTLCFVMCFLCVFLCLVESDVLWLCLWGCLVVPLCSDDFFLCLREEYMFCCMRGGW
jgi:hypothetical protein